MECGRMTHALLSPVSPVLSPELLRDIATTIFALAKADNLQIHLEHRAVGTARVMQGRIRLNESGDRIRCSLVGRYGQRIGCVLAINQLDDKMIREAVSYLDRVASELPGDPVQTDMPISSRTYLPNTTWKPSTVAAFHTDRHTVIPTLVQPVLDAGLRAAAFVGVTIRSTLTANRLGMFVADHECDSELTVTGWQPDGSGSGWAGQAVRDWSELDSAAVAREAVRLTQLAANPVALEPGRRVAILDRPAVAQLVRGMGKDFDARWILNGTGPLYDRVARRPKLQERVLDTRITISTDPNDAEGGYLPFNGVGYPLVPMTFIQDGIFERMAYSHEFAASQGVAPATDPPDSLRMSGGTTSVEEMISSCREGVYVNRFSQVQNVDPNSGLVTGTTNGACFLIKDGKITKAIKHFRFAESPWFIFNRILALGPSRRAPFGYAPWLGNWPVAPTIVPPVMVGDFNFSGLAEAV